LDLLAMVNRYSAYGFAKRSLCQQLGISVQSLYSFQHQAQVKATLLKRVQFNAITDLEKQAVVAYALAHTGYRHRELAYRLIDDDIAYMSPSSVYRILTGYNLINKNIMKRQPKSWDPHQQPLGPDEIWQSDLTYLNYNNRDYYLLLFLDVYSRFIVDWRLLTQMTGFTVRDVFADALQATGEHPILQTDRGSCFVSQQFHSLLAKANIQHRLIHPHCPNENAEIERVNRTLKEQLDAAEAASFGDLEQLIQQQIDYYNYERYHSAIGFIPPYVRYRGDPERIFQQRDRKLEQARKNRIKINWENYQRTTNK
jgi:putative transposase